MSTSVCKNCARLEHCCHCGGTLKRPRHSMTKLLAGAAVKAYRTALRQRSYIIHYVNDLEAAGLPITRNEERNWSKLRFHGLVAKYRDNTGHHPQGIWIVTRRCAQFVRGEIAIPKWVRTYHNHIVERSPERVTINNVWKDAPAIERLEDVEFDLHLPQPDPELVALEGRLV